MAYQKNLIFYLGIEKIIEYKNYRKNKLEMRDILSKKNNFVRMCEGIKYTTKREYYSFPWLGLKLGLKPVALIETEENQQDVNNVIEYAKKNNYHFVCQKYFAKKDILEFKIRKEFNNIINIFISENKNLAEEARICNNEIHLGRNHTPNKQLVFYGKWVLCLAILTVAF